jgi:hypothetical protein
MQYVMSESYGSARQKRFHVSVMTVVTTILSAILQNHW